MYTKVMDYKLLYLLLIISPQKLMNKHEQHYKGRTSINNMIWLVFGRHQCAESNIFKFDPQLLTIIPKSL